jgi:hypothetical protein
MSDPQKFDAESAREEAEESARALASTMNALAQFRAHIPDAQWRIIQELLLKIEQHTEARVRTGKGRTVREVMADAMPNTPVGRMFDAANKLYGAVGRIEL